jgi:stage III sporulation protein AG
LENKWRGFVEKLKSEQGMPKKNRLLILFLVGLLLLVVIWPTSDSQKTPAGSEDMQNASSESPSDSTEAYEEYLEKRVANALEYVEGVGRAEVIITLKSTGQKVVEKDQNTTSQTTSEEDSQGGTRTTEDRTSDKTSVYEQQSDGTQTPYVSKELTPEIEGVVVIADGGDNAVVVQNITEAVQALFGVEAHKIKIMKRTDT